ncbi:MAG: methyltransferase family protein [Candidatus Binatia bacterium]
MVGMALGVLFAVGWIPLFVFRAEATQAALPYYGAVERFWVRISPMVIALHVTLASILASLTPAPAWRIGLGVGLFAAGVAFWFWARAQIGPLAITRLPDEAPAALRRDGAFGLVRNPLYLGYLIAAAAPLVVAARPILLATYAACFVVLAVRAEQEEQRLHTQLGLAYAQYCREVKRLIPFVW